MILYSQWLSLPLSKRVEIARALGIAKTLPTHVQDNVVVQDGFKVQDVESALTVERLESFLGTDETDLQSLWLSLIEHFTPPEPAPPVTEVLPVPEPIIEKAEKIEVVKLPVKKVAKKKSTKKTT